MNIYERAIELLDDEGCGYTCLAIRAAVWENLPLELHRFNPYQIAEVQAYLDLVAPNEAPVNYSWVNDEWKDYELKAMWLLHLLQRPDCRDKRIELLQRAARELV
jgi:hypothetical protein